MKLKVGTVIFIVLLVIIVVTGFLDYLYFTGVFDLPFETKKLDKLNEYVKDKFFPPEEYKSDNGVLLYIDSPNMEKVHNCGMKIKGTALSNWYFEGSFTIDLLDSDDKLLQRVIASTTEDWMQDGVQLPFEAEIICEDSCPISGHLVLSSSDPTGLDEVDKVSIPVRFDPECENDVEEIINVFWGNISIDPQLEHCDATYPYTRTVSIDEDPREYSLVLLFAGPTEKENKLGCYTSIPNSATYNSFYVEDDVAYVDLSSNVISNRITTCYKMMIVSQIENTLKQFPDIREVVITVDGEVDNDLVK